MGTCSLNQTVSNNEVHQDDYLTEDTHKISSTLTTKNNHELFTLSQFKTHQFGTLKFGQTTNNSNPNNNNLLKSQKISMKNEFSQQTNDPADLQQKTLPFSQKQNLFLKSKLTKSKNRNSSLRISGDFLKIKQKQACSQYKVLAKITNKKIGQLYKVLDKTTNQVRSLQIIKQDRTSIKTLNEINLLKKLDHPNIYHLYDVFLKKGFYYIIGQYIQGDNLFCLTKQHQIISQKKLSKVIKQAFLALNYLHFRGIMHRNIKPQTIVFQSKILRAQGSLPSIKLINFKKAAQISLIKQQVGSYCFMAPQMFMGSHNQKCDIWSVGVILYMLASGQLPFRGQTKQQIQQSVCGKDLYFDEEIWKGKSQSLKNLLKQLLQKSPSRRISAKQALDSKWFNQASQSSKILMSKHTMKNLLCTGGDSKFKTIIKTYLVKMTTSMQQRQQMAKKFQSIDKDKSGFIDKKQLIIAYKQIHGQQISKDIDLDDIVEKIDINNSGLIDFSQFMAAISQVQTLFAKDRLEKAFQFIDRDGTGQIEVSQLVELLHNQVEGDDKCNEDEQINQIMKEFDNDGDKIISKKQFIDFFLKLKQTGRPRTIINMKVDERR